MCVGGGGTRGEEAETSSPLHYSCRKYIVMVFEFHTPTQLPMVYDRSKEQFTLYVFEVGLQLLL